MSTGEPVDYFSDIVLSSFAESMAHAVDDTFMKSILTNTGTPYYSSASGAVATTGVYGPGSWSLPTTTSGTTTTASTSITMANNGITGVLSSNPSGNLQWNGNKVMTCSDTPSVSSVSEMLKDSMTRKIILCQNKEECLRKYGEYGLEIFDSLLADLLKMAIRSEETFNADLKDAYSKLDRLQEFVVSHVPDTHKQAMRDTIANI